MRKWRLLNGAYNWLTQEQINQIFWQGERMHSERLSHESDRLSVTGKTAEILHGHFVQKKYNTELMMEPSQFYIFCEKTACFFTLKKSVNWHVFFRSLSSVNSRIFPVFISPFSLKTLKLHQPGLFCQITSMLRQLILRALFCFRNGFFTYVVFLSNCRNFTNLSPNILKSYSEKT